MYRYYQSLLYLFLVLFVVHVFLTPISSSSAYISFLGYVGLAIEATLPLPQIFKNHQARSCKGFRLSVIANWLVGDTMKMSYFFFSSEIIPWAFRLCGIFQMCCDLYLGLQFYMYGDGSGVGRIPDLGIQMTEKSGRLR
jgi:PQ loop repeat